MAVPSCFSNLRRRSLGRAMRWQAQARVNAACCVIDVFYAAVPHQSHPWEHSIERRDPKRLVSPIGGGPLLGRLAITAGALLRIQSPSKPSPRQTMGLSGQAAWIGTAASAIPLWMGASVFLAARFLRK